MNKKILVLSFLGLILFSNSIAPKPQIIISNTAARWTKNLGAIAGSAAAGSALLMYSDCADSPIDIVRLFIKTHFKLLKGKIKKNEKKYIMFFDLWILVFGIFGYKLLNIPLHYSRTTVNGWLKSIAKKMATTNPSQISQETKNYYEKALNKILAMKDLHPAQEILAKKLLKSLQKLSEQQIDQEQSTFSTEAE